MWTLAAKFNSVSISKGCRVKLAGNMWRIPGINVDVVPELQFNASIPMVSKSLALSSSICDNWREIGKSILQKTV